MPLQKFRYPSIIRKRPARRVSYKSKTRSMGMTFRKKGLRGKLGKYNMHSYMRWASTAEHTTTAGTLQVSKVFSLDDTVNSSELTVLYDQYIIRGVLVRIQMVNPPEATNTIASGSIGSTTNWYPKVWYVRDYDDSATETISQIQQRNNAKCKILKPNSFVQFYIRPAVRNQLYLDGVTAASSPLWNQWLDCSVGTVPHYGLKLAFDTYYSQGQTWRFRIDYKYYLQFKNAR